MMKKILYTILTALFSLLFSFGFTTAVFANADIIPWSYTTGDSQVFTFHLPPQITDPYLRINITGGKKNASTVFYAEEDRAEVSIRKEGSYLIRVLLKGSEQLRQDVVRPVYLNVGYPVKVGKVYFLDHFRMHLAGGNIGYTFIVYPQFGYIVPDHIDAEMYFGDLVKNVSFNCGQRYLQTYGYCETNIVEFTPQEYEQVKGDTYTCFKTADTESCRIMRYYGFID